MTDRRRMVGAVASAALLLAVTACTGDSGSRAAKAPDKPVQKFTSRPDLTVPAINVEGDAPDPTTKSPLGEDLTFIALKSGRGPTRGPLIVDAEGDPVWINPVGNRLTYDFRVQRYQGEPVLTWWRGRHTNSGFGYGEYVIIDNRYREIETVTTPGVHADFHNMTLTDHGTALMTSFPIVRRDLSDMGGPENGYVGNCVVQEVDVETGRVLFKWSAIDHIPLSETTEDPKSNPDEPGTKEAPLDPYHFNSVNEDGKDGLLVSARNTSAVYRIDKSTGKLDWTLGGLDSDFEMTGDSEFYYQHDAQRRPDGTITLFDNQGAPAVGEESRGLRLELNTRNDTASVVKEYLPPDGRLSDSQGNMQVRENGNVVIGWGSEKYYSEYTEDGDLLFDAAVNGQSYRAFRFPWVGEPAEPPKFVLKKNKAYVSWNGATEVADWRFIAGKSASSATEVQTVPREKFETSVKMPGKAYIAAQALDESGKVLATAEPGGWPNGVADTRDRSGDSSEGDNEAASNERVVEQSGADARGGDESGSGKQRPANGSA